MQFGQPGELGNAWMAWRGCITGHQWRHFAEEASGSFLSRCTWLT
jgi:heme oxygenase